MNGVVREIGHSAGGHICRNGSIDSHVYSRDNIVTSIDWRENISTWCASWGTAPEYERAKLANAGLYN